MPKLIKNRALAQDPWTLIQEVANLEEIAQFNEQAIIVPLQAWQEHKTALQQRSGRCAVWLKSHELPSELGDDLHGFELIALHFPTFADGRAYSSARELRNNLAYKGEVRAIGDVLRDQLYYMARCGFDAFALRDDQNIEVALQAFDDFADGYQASVDKPLPLFRRRAS